MSAALLKKSLALCDNFDQNKLKSKKLKARVTKIGKKSELKSDKKLTVTEARRNLKSQEEILKHNLQMLKDSKKARKVKLNKDLTDRIIERATSRTHKTPKQITEAEETTAFTEEDFKKFEQEFIAD